MKLPDNLPPLPPVPEGFDRWEYRGTNWDSPEECTHAVYYGDGNPWVVLDICPHSGIYGISHYIEAVRDQPAESAATGVEARVCGWHPIETAPKSSRAVLIHCAEFRNTYVAENGSGKWRYFGSFNGVDETPTHWMPLPDPPKNC